MAEHRISISEEPVESWDGRLELDPRFGADVRFRGVVRELENGRRLEGIEYSAYKPMALRQLEQLCETMVAEQPDHRVLIHHRLGFVAIGEPSILIHLQAPHSKEAYALCEEYLRRIKTSVPIWKGPVYLD